MAIKDIFNKKNQVTPEFIKWWEYNYGIGRRQWYIDNGFFVWFEDMSYINGECIVWFRYFESGNVVEKTYICLGKTTEEISENTYKTLLMYNAEYIITSKLINRMEELKSKATKI
jgi:hypothetical protein